MRYNALAAATGGQLVSEETTEQATIFKRADQAFPTLTPAEIERVRRFGRLSSFKDGDALIRVGEPGHGLTIILSGRVAVTRRDQTGSSKLIVAHVTGSFMGELAQLAGRPALVDATA